VTASNDGSMPAELLTFDARNWSGASETAAVKQWRNARQAWSEEHGWHTSQESRVLEELHVAADALGRRLASCTSEEQSLQALAEHQAEHGGALRRLRDGLWQRSLRLSSNRSGHAPA
jgi:hypothetical protein